MVFLVELCRFYGVLFVVLVQIAKAGKRENISYQFQNFQKNVDIDVVIRNKTYSLTVGHSLSKSNNYLADFCEQVISSPSEVGSCVEQMKVRRDNALITIYIEHTIHMGKALSMSGYSLKKAEGGSLYFLRLLKLKQDLVTFSKSYKTVCETGFNVGHSSLLWLASNPYVNVVSFDIGLHDYVVPAADYIAKSFPGRFKLVIGDSQETLPLQGQSLKCDLFFIDGGHSRKVAQSDMFWAISYLNKDNPDARILVDDLHLPGVRKVWDMAMGNGLLTEVTIVEDEANGCIDVDNSFSTLVARYDDKKCVSHNIIYDELSNGTIVERMTTKVDPVLIGVAKFAWSGRASQD